jgi:uracil-DNA glycosylase
MKIQNTSSQEAIFFLQDLIIDEVWKNKLLTELSKPHIKNLINFLNQEKKTKKIIYPHISQIFASINLTTFHKVKLVIIGQDPYHGQQQANGLAFSVASHIKIPPSLKNIFKEISNDTASPIHTHGDLRFLANQGVLLLNSVLTVEAGRPGSHSNKGWEKLTDTIIDLLNKERANIVFLLWGKYAQNKARLIDSNKHYKLVSSHPSPLSYFRGFCGCNHFEKANKYLLEKKIKPISW